MLDDSGQDDTLTLQVMLKGAPTNWGRWGPGDQVGGLNFLGSGEVLRGLGAVRTGDVFTLGTRIAGEEGEPVTPERTQAVRLNTRDRASYTSGRQTPLPGGLEWADDTVSMCLQGTTHFDGVGHAWYDGQLYNGYSAEETVDHMSKGSILPIAEKGVVGRAVLIDVARHLGKRRLGHAEGFTLDDVHAAARAQGTTVEPRDIVLLRTGWVSLFYEDPEAFQKQPFIEPGLIYSDAVAKWFHEMEIPVYGTDTVANELQPQPGTGVMSILHAALMRNLGVVFNEILWLEDLAEACAGDGRWEFLYVAAPLKVVGGTGAPVNPVAVR